MTRDSRHRWRLGALALGATLCGLTVTTEARAVILGNAHVIDGPAWGRAWPDGESISALHQPLVTPCYCYNGPGITRINGGQSACLNGIATGLVTPIPTPLADSSYQMQVQWRGTYAWYGHYVYVYAVVCTAWNSMCSVSPGAPMSSNVVQYQNRTIGVGDHVYAYTKFDWTDQTVASISYRSF